MKTKQLIKLGFIFTVAFVFSSSAFSACVEQYDREKPDHMYVADANGNVTDLETGLIWYRCPVGTTWNNGAGTCDGTVQQLSWQDALNTADSASLGGQTDWRLPNKKALSSLVDISCSNPAINNDIFPLAGGVSKLWTSTHSVGSAKKAWQIKYKNGDDITGSKTGLVAVYLVRN